MLNSQMYRILVVDDFVDNVFLLQTLLEAEGYAVETATSGYAALRKLQDTQPHLVLLDVMMPEMDGYEVTRRIRQDSRSAAVPILLITAHDSASAARGFTAGANGFIHKPIDFDELMWQVQALLKQASPLQMQPVSSYRP